MSSIVLKTSRRRTSVSKSTLRRAVSAVYAQNTTPATTQAVITITKKEPKRLPAKVK